jgi:outer membrane receptor protein involved in Fe transport
MDHDQRQRFDGDFSNYPAASLTALSITNLSNQVYSQRQSSQRLRLEGEQGPWRWMAGALGLAAGPTGTAPYHLGVTRDTRHASVFGAQHRELGDAGSVGLEARLSRNRHRYRQGGWTVQEATLARGIPACPPQQPGRTPSSCVIEARIESDGVTPRLIVEYRPFEDALACFSAARGAKPAGFNVNEVTSYADQQIGTQHQTPGVLLTSSIVNAGRVDSYGLEATLRWRINPVLAVDLRYAFTHATDGELVYGGTDGRVASDLLRAEAGNLLDEDRIQSAIRFIDLGTTENFAPQRDYLAFLARPRTAGVRVTFDF